MFNWERVYAMSFQLAQRCQNNCHCSIVCECQNQKTLHAQACDMLCWKTQLEYEWKESHESVSWCQESDASTTACWSFNFRIRWITCLLPKNDETWRGTAIQFCRNVTTIPLYHTKSLSYVWQFENLICWDWDKIIPLLHLLTTTTPNPLPQP